MKNTTVMTLLLCGLLLAPLPVKAESFDVRELTCRDTGGTDETILLLYWLDGYLSGRTGDTRYSDKWIEYMAEHIEAACEKNSRQSILSIIEKLKNR